MGLTDLLFGKYVCDVCGRKMRNISDGYILTTPEVLSSELYWRHYFKNMHPELQFADRQGKSVPLLVKELASIAGQSNGWLVCSSCSGSFHFDKSFSQGGGVGSKRFNPADFEKTLIVAASAWNSVYGYQPALNIGESAKDFHKQRNNPNANPSLNNWRTTPQGDEVRELSRAEIAERELKKMREQD
jgi:hypothetical protein